MLRLNFQILMLQRSYPQDGVNFTQLTYFLKRNTESEIDRFEQAMRLSKPDLIPPEHFRHPHVSLEIGAGTGWMVMALARRYPDRYFIAVERDRMRGTRLVDRSRRSGLKNLASFRGNAVPAIIHGVPDRSLDTIYLMYPCPFPKSSQCKNRWYLHPAMRHLVRALKPGGRIVWASDQKFYIDEAAMICERVHGLSILCHGEIKPNPWNHLDQFPAGRTKFEQYFLSSGQPCHELVVEKPA